MHLPEASREADWPSLCHVSSSGPIKYDQRMEPLATAHSAGLWRLVSEVKVCCLELGPSRGR